MPNGTQLQVVRSMVKSERGISLSTNDVAQDAEINQIIWDTQQNLANSYDWSFLKTRWDSFIPPSQRYTAFPTVSNLNVTTSPNLERPIECLVKWNAIWQPVIYGIDEQEEFNYLDSDRGQVLDPIQRWQFSDLPNFEVWPLPASQAQLRFVGQRVLKGLQTQFANLPITWTDTATLDLDDLLVTYLTAGEYATRQNQPRIAQILLDAGQRRLASLRGSYQNRTQPMIMGRGVPFNRQALRQVPLVLVAGK